MGLFNIFKKKKKTDTTFPENELEKKLMESATKVSARSEFYQKLLWNQLYVLTNGRTTLKEGGQILEKGTTVEFVTFETGEIPVFTSTNRIFDKGVIKEEVPFIALKGHDLFDLTRGAKFILNPYSDYGKELLPNEIESLLDGTIFEKNEEAVKIEKFNELFDLACKKQEGLVLLDGYRQTSLNPTAREKLESSVTYFKQCLEIFPDHWQSMFLMAKSHQRLGNHAESLELMEKAFRVETEDHSIPMEASLEAMHLGDIEKALYYSEESLKRKPNDFALLGNHAMNLLIAERDVEAKNTIEKAIKLNPRDPINKNVKSVIGGVISGKRERPTFKDAIQ